MSRGTAPAELLRVDPTACRAHGLCAEMLSERVTLDEWGYPLVDGSPMSGSLLRAAHRAAAACPVRALHLAAPVTPPAIPSQATASGHGEARP